MSEYYSNEYLNGLPAQREVRLKAWARSRLAAAKYDDQAEAFMAESFEAGGEALGPFKAVGTAGKILKPAVQGAISGFAFFDPHEERLANMIQAWPAVANPITEFMAAKEGEGRLEGRLKSFVPGIARLNPPAKGMKFRGSGREPIVSGIWPRPDPPRKVWQADSLMAYLLPSGAGEAPAPALVIAQGLFSMSVSRAWAWPEAESLATLSANSSTVFWPPGIRPSISSM